MSVRVHVVDPANIYHLDKVPQRIGGMIFTIFTIVSSIVAWWKNNSFTKKAIAADKTFK